MDAFLLDGQQRLTSLYQSLRHEGPVDTHDNRGKRRIKRWYYIDMLAAMDPQVGDREDAIVSVPEDKKETRNFGREVIRDLSSRELEYEQHMMPTERLLDNSLSWLFGYVGHWNGRDDEHPDGGGFSFYERFNQYVMSQFSEYSLPVISLDKETPKEAVCTVFEKVNTGGVTLSMFELVTASFAAQDENLSLREDWGARRNHLHSAFGSYYRVSEETSSCRLWPCLTTQKRRLEADRGRTSLRIVYRRSIAGRTTSLSLEVSDYHEWADRVEKGFLEAAKFLHSQFIFTRYDVPYNTQLVPLAALYVELGERTGSGHSEGQAGEMVLVRNIRGGLRRCRGDPVRPRSCPGGELGQRRSSSRCWSVRQASYLNACFRFAPATVPPIRASTHCR